MALELPTSVLVLPVAHMSLAVLPATKRRVLERRIRTGEIRTIEDLVSRVTPSELHYLQPQIQELVPLSCAAGVEDLLDGLVVDLLRSVGPYQPTPIYSWVTPRQVLQGKVFRAGREEIARVTEALAIRSARRSAFGALEQEREPMRASAPVPELVPFWRELRRMREQLRPVCIPEDEYDKLVRHEIEPDPLAVKLSSVDGRWVTFTLPDAAGRGFHLQCSADRRWGLGGIDRVLDALGDPESELRSELLEILRRPTWERDLRRLDDLLGRVDTEPRVIGWRVVQTDRGTSFRPVQCTPKKKGGFTARNTSLQELGGALDPVDRRAAGLLRRWKSPPPEIAALVAESLVGHPRVFAPGSGGAIRVRRTELSLAFAHDASGVQPRVEVDGLPVDVQELAGHLHDDGADTWLRLLPTELQVVELRQEVTRVLVDWLGRAGVVSDDGVGALLARLPSLSPLVPVRLDPSLRGTEVEGDPRPLLRVTWDGATLGIDVRVRPLPELPPTLPGEGLSELVTMRSGAPCFARRDLGSEPERVSTALAPLALGDPQPGWRWVVTDTGRAIDVLLAISESGGALRTEWEGPSLTVGRAEGARLKVRVASGRDWFDVSGSFELDEGTVDLSDVLAALREGRSFFQVRPNVFVRIAEQLRGALRAVAAAEDGGRITPLQAPILVALSEVGAEVDGSERFEASIDRIRASASHLAEIPSQLVGVLRDYQVEGFRWLARLATWAPGAVLADDMGLGKTIQAIALLSYREGPALVVCPLSVLANWEAELARFAPALSVVRYRGANRARQLEACGPRSVVLTSWDLLARDPALAEVPWGTVVLDEAQAIKNAHTARSKATRALQAGFVVALTGTPVENRSEELWSLFRAVAPGLLGGEKRFGERFAGPIDRAEPGARDVLARLVRPFVLRRTKSEVAPELPSRTEIVVRVPLSPDERALYDTARLEALVRASEASGPGQRFEVLRWLTRLRQLACHPRLLDPGSPVASSKLAQIRHRIADLRDTGHRALVFSQFVTHLQLVREALEADGVRVRWLTGDVDEAQRRKEVAAFQAGEGDVFLISLGAGGTGLNLTAATYVFHLDPWWNPAREDQASDRAHRIGQTKPVTVYRLVAEGTIEEQILALHEHKRDLADALLAGADGAARIGTDELLELLSDAAGGPTQGESAVHEAVAELRSRAGSERPAMRLLDRDPVSSSPASQPVPTDPAPTPEAVEIAVPKPKRTARRRSPAVAPPVSEASPDASPAAVGLLPPSAEILAAFRRALEADYAAGRIESLDTVRAHEIAVEHLFAWASPPAHRAALATAAAAYLGELALGRLPHDADRLFAKPAFSRLLALLDPPA